ncbi:MAG: DUF1992 domain-containing protein [Chloroflexota bacterium]
MNSKDRAVDIAVRKAIEEGAFDNLSGKGKPLKINANPYADAEWRTAFDLLQKEGFALPWMEKRSLIEKELDQAKENLARVWTWAQKETSADEDSFWVEHGWKTAQNKFREKIAELNKRIDDYNLEVPKDNFNRLRINGDKEVEKIKG